MIITKEMICSVDACASSMPDLDAYISLYGEDKDFKEIKRIILRDHPEWTYLVQWLMTKTPYFIKMGEHTIVEEYRISTNDGQFLYFSSYEEAKDSKKQEILDSIQHILEQVVISHEEQHNDDNVTWHLIDLTDCPEEGNFQIFNPLTGTHEKVVSKTEALNKQSQIKDNIIQGYFVLVEQKITNSFGDVCWVSV
jgi:hypothetical protein